MIAVIALALFCPFSYGGEAVSDSTNSLEDVLQRDVGSYRLDTADQPRPNLRKVPLPKFEAACYFAPDDPDFRWIGASNRILPWMTGSDLRTIYDREDDQNPAVPPPNRRGLFLILKLEDGKCLALLPLAGPESCSYLTIGNEGDLAVGYSTASTIVMAEGPIPLIAWARGENVQEACRKVWQEALSLPEYTNRLRIREAKEYPKFAEYLGWCSWEQFHHNINTQVLTEVVNEIEASNVPIRWVLIDDGHQTDNDRSLVSLEPDRAKFPEGWDFLLNKRRPDGIRWVGIWHCLLGQWDNIDATHQMPWLQPYLVRAEPDQANSTWVPKVDPSASNAFYDEFVGAVEKQGFDFMKIDNMSRSTFSYAKGPYNPARAEWLNVHSLDQAAHVHRLPYISCSSLNATCLLNTWHNAIMRCSIDYKLNESATAKSHVYQSFANTLWLGQTLWPDHDMFHSADVTCGELMAVTKALSGGPIYVSDHPEDFQRGFIMPLCYQDGKLLRPLAPGVPLRGSEFRDALNDASQPYMVTAPTASGAVVIAGFNLVHPTPADAVYGKVTTDDYDGAWGLVQTEDVVPSDHPQGLVAYNWRNGEGTKLSSEGIPFSIEGFDYQLFVVAPIRDSWAVVGRSDKYLSPSAITSWKTTPDHLEFTLHESGPVVIFSERGPVASDEADFRPIGNGFWKADLATGESPVTIQVTR